VCVRVFTLQLTLRTDALTRTQLTAEVSNIVPDIIKPFVDLVWFTQQAWLLIGWRNTALLYTYLAAGLGLLRAVTPAFDQLVMTLTKLQAGLRCAACCDGCVVEAPALLPIL
jgi:hypothetical protein